MYGQDAICHMHLDGKQTRDREPSSTRQGTGGEETIGIKVATGQASKLGTMRGAQRGR